MCSARINQPVLKREIKVLSQYVSVSPFLEAQLQSNRTKEHRVNIYKGLDLCARILEKFSFSNNLGRNVLHKHTSVDLTLILTSSKETEAGMNM